MTERNRLSRVFSEAVRIPFDDSSRIILFSDCHRGDGSWADDFSKNRNAYSAALTHYFYNNYIYIELGDGDELWKNRRFADIAREYGDVFLQISEFIKADRFYSLFGNHDFIKKDGPLRGRALRRLAELELADRDLESVHLFAGTKHREGLVLRNESSGYEVFLVHGHQADFVNDQMKQISRFLVRYLWRPLEILGLNDPASPAENRKKRTAVERKLTEWVRRENQMMIAGHTHRTVFPEAGGIPYFNDGCCIYPNGITGIEIAEGNILLVKWSIKVKKNGTLFAGKDILAGPRKLTDYFKVSIPH